MTLLQSRNQHENGFRHRNAKERHLRNIYKTGAEKKRTDELERREMEKIDRVRLPCLSLPALLLLTAHRG